MPANAAIAKNDPESGIYVELEGAIDSPRAETPPQAPEEAPVDDAPADTPVAQVPADVGRPAPTADAPPSPGREPDSDPAR